MVLNKNQIFLISNVVGLTINAALMTFLTTRIAKQRKQSKVQIILLKDASTGKIIPYLQIQNEQFLYELNDNDIIQVLIKKEEQ